MWYYLENNEIKMTATNKTDLCTEYTDEEIVSIEGKLYFKKDVAELLEKQENEKLLEKEMAELQLWFEEYDNQVKQYIRCQRLGIEFDKDINELDSLAQEKAKRISEIRELLKGEQDENI